MTNCADSPTTKQNIMQTTLEMIKAEGVDNITLRKIAAAADVNVALVNYYFGSKDKLINESLKSILCSFREALHILDDKSLPPKERLKTFLLQYVHFILKYPGLLREVLGKGNITFESQLEFSTFMKTIGVNKLKANIEEITGEQNSDILNIMVLQINAAVFFPICMDQHIKKKISIHELIPIEQQIDILFDHYFSQNST